MEVNVILVPFALLDLLYHYHVLQVCTAISTCLVHHLAIVHVATTVLVVIILLNLLISHVQLDIIVQKGLVFHLHVQ